MLRNRLDIQLRNVCLICRVYGWLQSFWNAWTPLHSSWNPWNIQPSQGTGQGVSMTFNASSRLRSLGDRSAALGGLHSVPKSAVLPYASGVGGLSRRLLNRATPYVAAAGHSPSSAMGQTAVPPTPLHRPPFLPGRSWGRSASRDAFLQEIPTTGENFQRPRPPPRKAPFCPTPPFQNPKPPFQNPKSGC